MRSHITGIELNIDLEAFVAEDTLLLAEDSICEFWIEGLDLLGARVGGLYERDGECFICVNRPWCKVSMNQ